MNTSLMCTQRYIVFTHCACTPVLILKCPAQEFVESQVRTKNRKKPLIYKYCVNFMATSDVWSGCCRGKAEEVCFAERGKRKMEVTEGVDEGVEESDDFGDLRSLPLAIDGRIGEWYEGST
jgi:hypothetical protein